MLATQMAGLTILLGPWDYQSLFGWYGLKGCDFGVYDEELELNWPPRYFMQHANRRDGYLDEMYGLLPVRSLLLFAEI